MSTVITAAADETVIGGPLVGSVYADEAEKRLGPSWGAVLAGTAVASAFSIVLVALGSGIGLASISPWGNNPSATTLGVLAIAWFIAIALFANGLGGYIAGRLRPTWASLHTDEVFFRDTAHGLLVWTLTTVVTAFLLASTFATVGAGTAAAKPDLPAYLTDKLFRSDKPPAADAAVANAEAGRILTIAASRGTMDPADQTYLGQLVSRQTGLAQADADKRVTEVVNEGKAAADKARHVGATLALWAFIGLLVGAFSACFLATIGGRVRDELPAMPNVT